MRNSGKGYAETLKCRYDARFPLLVDMDALGDLELGSDLLDCW